VDLCCASLIASHDMSDLGVPDPRSRERLVCTLVLLGIRDADISISAYKQLKPVLVLPPFKRRQLLSRAVPAPEEVSGGGTHRAEPDVLVPYNTHILCPVILVRLAIRHLQDNSITRR
jgi:hypothetical protein